MNTYKHLKNVLDYNIKKMADCPSLFCENPEADFTRNRKLDFETVMKYIICMETGSLNDDLLKLNDFSTETPTASAFIQARSKIKVDAFQTLFNRFNEKTTELRYGTHAKAYSAYHLNASYDLLECTYDDLMIQGEAKKMKMMSSVR